MPVGVVWLLQQTEQNKQDCCFVLFSMNASLRAQIFHSAELRFGFLYLLSIIIKIKLGLSDYLSLKHAKPTGPI